MQLGHHLLHRFCLLNNFLDGSNLLIHGCGHFLRPGSRLFGNRRNVLNRAGNFAGTVEHELYFFGKGRDLPRNELYTADNFMEDLLGFL